MSKIKVGGRIAAGFICMIAVAAITIAIVTLQTNAASKNAALANEVRAPAAITSLKLSKAVVTSANALRGYILTRDPGMRDQWSAAWVEIEQNIATMDGLSGRFTNPKNREAWREARELLPEYKAAQASVLTLAATAEPTESAAALRSQVLPLFNEVQTLLVGPTGKEGLAGSQSGLLTSGLTATTNSIAQANLLLLIGGVVMVALGVLVAWITTKAITTPLGRLTDVLRVMAGGRFDVDVPGADRGDEIGDVARAAVVFKENGAERDRLTREAAQFQAELDRKLKETEEAFEAAGRSQKLMVDYMARDLKRLASGDLAVRLTETVAPDYQALKDDFNAAVASLEEAILTISSATSGIGSGSEEIAQASDDLSRRTEQQAASLEETAAALDEITATVRRTASGAQQASEAVTGARADAEQSGVVVRQAVAAMGEIETSSEQIGQIIGVIDEIAFQTNLLALNAGVEAARAGDAGKGFAVVASEVRALAQRSAEAAKEIKSLISTSAGQVGQGVALVRQTGEALHRIVDQVAGINDLVMEIAASAQEQATGLGQVNVAVNQMDQVIQQNAAMVEQATAATMSLKSETMGLTALVSRFKVGGGARPEARPAANPVHFAQARLAGFPKTAGANALKQDTWEEF